MSGNNAVRILIVNSSANLTLNTLTLSNGKTVAANRGGAILNNSGGTLSVTNCTFSSNASDSDGGAINSLGALTITGSTFSGNTSGGFGGAVGTDTSTSSLSITRSTFSGNNATSGGGASITNTANFTGTDPTNFTLIVNSTLSGNSTSGQGGGLQNANGLTRLESCTIAGNSAATGNGSGVASQGISAARTRVQNSIIADNRTSLPGSADSGTDVDLVFGGTQSFVSSDNNAIGNGAAAFAASEKGITASGLNLDALADKGGLTKTRALLAGSVAVNAGSNANVSGLTTDQRGTGFARIKAGTVDIGAFEVQNDAPTDIALSSDSIAENNAANATVGTLSTTDPNTDDSFTYSLVSGTGSTDNAAFNISGNALRATNSFDFETKSS